MNKHFSKVTFFLGAFLVLSQDSLNAMQTNPDFSFDIMDSTKDFTVGSLALGAVKWGAIGLGVVAVNSVIGYSTQRLIGKMQDLDPSLAKPTAEVVFPKEKKAFIPKETALWDWMCAIKRNKVKSESWQDLFTNFKEEERESRFGHTAERGVILVGPPGVGKTAMAEELARRLKTPFIKVSGSDFTNKKYVGTGVMGVNAFFDKAKKLVAQYGDVVALVDEVDSLPARTDNEFRGMHNNEAVNALLQKIDEMPIGLRLVLATNHIDFIDQALKRAKRLKVIQIEFPDKANRLKALVLHTQQRPIYSSARTFLQTVAECTYDFSFAELAKLVNDASENAEKSYSTYNALAITKENFKEALMESLKLKIESVGAGIDAVEAQWIRYGFKPEAEKGKEKVKNDASDEQIDTAGSIKEKLESRKSYLTQKLKKHKYYYNTIQSANSDDFDSNEEVIGQAPKVVGCNWFKRFYTKFNSQPYIKYPCYGVGIGAALYYRNLYMPYMQTASKLIIDAEIWKKTAISVPHAYFKAFGINPANLS